MTTAARQDEEAKKKPRQSCTDHCSTCGAHFHGLGAFDAHRKDGYCLEPQEAANKDGRLLLQLWTSEGVCHLAPGCKQDGRLVRELAPVAIWQRAVTAEQVERMQTAFAAMRVEGG